MFEEYRSETEHLWNDKRNKYGSRVFWRERQNKNGKTVFHGQPLGKGWFYQYPKDIAKYLNRKDWREFRGHSICRFGSTVYADTGASILKLKKYGGWKSNKAAESYYDNSLKNKMDTSKAITTAMKSVVNNNHNSRKRKRADNDDDDYDIDHKKQKTSFENCTFTFTNCSFNNCDD